MNGPLEGHRVVVVDDDVAVRQALSLYLEALHGCQVTAVADLESLAMALAGTTSPPALLIADFNLGYRKTGLDAVNVAREFYGTSVPALLLTGDSGVALSPAIPALRVLIKPFVVDAFSAALDELVAPGQSSGPP